MALASNRLKSVVAAVKTLADQVVSIVAPVSGGGAQQYTTGWFIAGTGANVNRSGGSSSWSNPGNVTADDSIDATVGVSGTSHWLVASNFGITSGDVPTGATIDGVEVEFEWQGNNTTEPFESAIHIDTQASTAPPGSGNKSTGAPLGIAEVTKIFGANNDTWGLSLSPNDIHGSGFSAWLSVGNSSGSDNANVDYIRVRITYTA